MTKRERVIAAIKGLPHEGVPSGFSLHFPSEIAHGEPAVEAHLDFFKKTDTDILKIMNENFVPTLGRKVNSAKDMEEACRDTSFVNDQLELIKKILDRCDPDGFTINTVHGITASTLHPIEHFGVPYEQARIELCERLRENGAILKDAMKRVRDAMCELSVKCIELGMDGIYYASLGGEPWLFTDEEFAQYIAPLEIEILDAIRAAGGYSILHICKDGLNMQRYADYGKHTDVVNWGVFEVPFSIDEGKKFFKDVTIFGGLQNRGGVLETGTAEEIAESVKKLVASVNSDKFILGADCTLATDIDYARIRTAVDAAHSC